MMFVHMLVPSFLFFVVVVAGFVYQGCSFVCLVTMRVSVRMSMIVPAGSTGRFFAVIFVTTNGSFVRRMTMGMIVRSTSTVTGHVHVMFSQHKGQSDIDQDANKGNARHEDSLHFDGRTIGGHGNLINPPQGFDSQGNGNKSQRQHTQQSRQRFDPFQTKGMVGRFGQTGQIRRPNGHGKRSQIGTQMRGIRQDGQRARQVSAHHFDAQKGQTQERGPLQLEQDLIVGIVRVIQQTVRFTQSLFVLVVVVITTTPQGNVLDASIRTTLVDHVGMFIMGVVVRCRGGTVFFFFFFAVMIVRMRVTTQR
mmetsp:Transcript_3981/g.7946  ORF Transcript_3981/g.7946 Transcript_3981/m.7946 type:complete len:307 (-) Transcript_3981:91-1011(-)